MWKYKPNKPFPLQFGFWSWFFITLIKIILETQAYTEFVAFIRESHFHPHFGNWESAVQNGYLRFLS